MAYFPFKHKHNITVVPLLVNTLLDFRAELKEVISENEA
jgi:hypothetical protein